MASILGAIFSMTSVFLLCNDNLNQKKQVRLTAHILLGLALMTALFT